MAIIYEVTAKTGVYEKDGQERARYQRIGSVIETKKGPMLKLDQIPIVEGGWEGWAYLFTPMTEEEKEAKRNGNFSRKKTDEAFDDLEF